MHFQTNKQMQFLQAPFSHHPHLQICSQPVNMYLISSEIELFQAEMARNKQGWLAPVKCMRGCPLTYFAIILEMVFLASSTEYGSQIITINFYTITL